MATRLETTISKCKCIVYGDKREHRTHYFTILVKEAVDSGYLTEEAASVAPGINGWHLKWLSGLNEWSNVEFAESSGICIDLDGT